ncbi:hypothetical protein GF373_14105, partial [bacterium]|nr:hypothetical protein [bacterium]
MTMHLNSYFSVITNENIWLNKCSLKFYLDYLFHGVSFQDKHVLDIGAGVGLYSFYAACSGAKNVVALEPEAAGSQNRMIDTFHRLKEQLNINHVHLFEETFQHHKGCEAEYDIVIMHNSINHLNESACMQLHTSSNEGLRARNLYLSFFEKLHKMMGSNSRLILADCSRYNLFRFLPMKNPFCHSIEWEKHQS